MKVRALKHFLHNGVFFTDGQEYEINNNDGLFLLEKKYVIRLDEPETIAKQISLDCPAFGINNDIPIKESKRGRKRKNA